ncbi:uncharacterized protein BROUX77_003410 [Berkeleyomyces rouxiae]
MAHFIPCDSSLDAAGFAKLYLSAVYRLHGLPLDIVSDRGSLFTSAFSKALAKLLGIKQNLSTAFHPQTDGQTERVNSILEQYLRGYTNYRQDNWADLLPLAEFSYNDSESSSTMLTPFFANHGFHPRSGRESLPVSVEKGPLRNFVKELDNICQFLKTEITWSRERMTEYANRHKSSAPLLREGDLVWLLSRNIRTTRPSKKLDFKKLGPFKILRKVSSHAYELALPATMKVHPVFHVCLLEPCASDPLPGQKNPPPPPVIVDGEEEFVVKEIIGVSSRGPLQYQVVWEGYEHDGPSWDPDTAMADADAPTESPDTWTVVAKRAQKKAANKTTTPAPNTTTTTTTTTAPREKTAVVIVTTPESRASALPQRRVRDAVNRLLGKTAVSAVQRTKAGNILLHAVDSEAVKLMTSNLQRVVKELSCFGACEFTRATSPGSRTHKSSKLCFVIHGVPIEDGFDSLKELPKDMADFNGVKISDSLRWLVVPAKGKQAGSVVVEALTQADYDKCVGKNVNVGGAIVPAVPYVDRKSTTDGPPRL